MVTPTLIANFHLKIQKWLIPLNQTKQQRTNKLNKMCSMTCKIILLFLDIHKLIFVKYLHPELGS
jgi:hypothetical protein